MKKRLVNTVVIILIAALSVGFGFLYSKYDIERKKRTYPREYQAEITPLSYSYNVPVSVIYAAVKVRSDFSPALRSEDGRIGLLQLTPEQFSRFESELGGRTGDPGLLYEPSTNLRLGTYWISLLFAKYASWDTVYAAMYAGEETVDRWIEEEGRASSAGSAPDGTAGGEDTRPKLSSVPDAGAAAYVELMKKTVKMYVSLYEGTGGIN
jgi:soluble lytic murein transglycosylase